MKNNIEHLKYKIAIFDLDGTLLNTLSDLADSCNYILEKNNFPPHSIEEIRFFVGNGIPKLIERALPSSSDDETKKNILTQFVEYYGANSAKKTCAYDGILELLKNLKARGVIVAVNTNKHEGTSVELCKKYFFDLIDAVAGGKVGVHHKPDPTGVFSILEKFNLQPSDAIFIGDSDVDFLTAKNAGTDYALCDWGFRGKDFLIEHGAKIDRIAMNAKELETMIL